MTKLTSFRGFFMVAIFVVCFATTVNAAPQSTTPSAAQTITDSSPSLLLAHILVGTLQDFYGVPITFEDTRHVNDAELDKSKPHSFLAERISITYSVTTPPEDADLPTRKAMAGEVVRDVVRKYNAARGTEIYQVTETDNGFHVVGRRFLDTSGKMEDFQPLLDTPITIEPGERTVSDVLDEMTNQINSAHGPVHSFTISFRSLGGRPKFLYQKTSLSATNEPARSVFDRLFSGVQITALKDYPGKTSSYQVPASLSWELNSGFSKDIGGMMHVYVVKPPGAH